MRVAIFYLLNLIDATFTWWFVHKLGPSVEGNPFVRPYVDTFWFWLVKAGMIGVVCLAIYLFAKYIPSANERTVNRFLMVAIGLYSGVCIWHVYGVYRLSVEGLI